MRFRCEHLFKRSEDQKALGMSPAEFLKKE